MPRKEAGATVRREAGEGGFNEAGALCPGKRWLRRRGGPAGRGFNEAGALCPGKRPPGRAAAGPQGRPASMRPGHCAPEREVVPGVKIGVPPLQ